MIRGLGRGGEDPARIPRESGDDPPLYGGLFQIVRVFPARAGMIRATNRPIQLSSRIPRESGDDPYEPLVLCAGVTYSPRGRG